MHALDFWIFLFTAWFQLQNIKCLNGFSIFRQFLQIF